jgi:hypothetical protein
MSNGPLVGVWHRKEEIGIRRPDPLRSPSRPPGGREPGPAYRPPLAAITVGTLAGLVGSVAATCWLVVQDFLMGAPLRTPALLAAALVDGLAGPPEPVVSTPLIFKYAAAQVVVLVVFGWMVSALLAAAERWPRILFGLLFLMSCFAVSLLAGISGHAEWLLDVVELRSILGANLLAVAGMLTVFAATGRFAWGRRATIPGLRRRVYRAW